MATGMSACNAILLALLARDRLGRGQHVEVALFDIAVAMTGFYGMAYLMSGENSGRSGQFAERVSFGRRSTDAADAPFYMACANDRLYRRLVIDVLGRPDLASGPNSPTGGRERPTRKNCARSSPGFLPATARESWVAKMKSANIPVGYLRTVEEAFNSPEVRERHRVSQIPHPTAGTVPNIEAAAQPRA